MSKSVQERQILKYSVLRSCEGTEVAILDVCLLEPMTSAGQIGESSQG